MLREPTATLPEVHQLTREEARELVDRQARRYLNMSGEAFLRAWEAGQFDDNPDQPDVMRIAMLLPAAR